MEKLATLQERDQQARDSRIFELQMEQFWKNWAPDDKYEAARFQAELSSLIRQVYREAQEPIARQFTALMATMPVWPPK
jgi:hypothetical protein